MSDYLPPPPPTPRWGTRVPRRSPEFKQHNTLGAAKNALLCHALGTLYEWDGALWQVHYTSPGRDSERARVVGHYGEMHERVGAIRAALKAFKETA